LSADPKFATVHVNDRTAVRGVNNDNSIGIELVRSGKQKYTQKQLSSLVALTDYIEDRFNISRIYGHGEIQPSDRRDPVAFNWARFSKNLAVIQRGPMDTETAYRATDETDG
jgi:N-acetyl-anhydromuramyl-L-alanine amidase AmpD